MVYMMEMRANSQCHTECYRSSMMRSFWRVWAAIHGWKAGRQQGWTQTWHSFVKK